MLKIWGSLFIVCASTLLGMYRAAEFQKQYREMEYVNRLLTQMQSEIRYARSSLGEIFARMGKDACEPYKSWFFAMVDGMKRRDGESLARIWSDSVKKCLKNAGLPGEETERLAELGSQLVSVDIEQQIRVIDLYLARLALSMKERREEMKAKVKLCRCLGMMGGLLIVTLLL